MAWPSIETDYQHDDRRDSLRLAVEGPEYAKLPALRWEAVPQPAGRRYPSHPDAAKLIAHAGWGVVLDALINGHTEKIASVFSQLFGSPPSTSGPQPQPSQPLPVPAPLAPAGPATLPAFSGEQLSAVPPAPPPPPPSTPPPPPLPRPPPPP